MEVVKWIQESIAANPQIEELKILVNDQAYDALKKTRAGFVYAESATTEQVEEVKGALSKLREEFSIHEDFFFDHLKRGVYLAEDNPGYATLAAITAIAFIHRGSRRFIFRNTVGRLRSEEAQLVAAENRLKDLSTSVNLHGLDKNKLLERANSAQQEFVSGKAKLRSTGSELLRLWKNISTKESEAKRLRETLRELPLRESIKLRAEVAAVLSDARKQKLELGRRLDQINRLGINA